MTTSSSMLCRLLAEFGDRKRGLTSPLLNICEAS
jgi:hypothetical protein